MDETGSKQDQNRTKNGPKPHVHFSPFKTFFVLFYNLIQSFLAHFTHQEEVIVPLTSRGKNQRLKLTWGCWINLTLLSLSWSAFICMTNCSPLFCSWMRVAYFETSFLNNHQSGSDYWKWGMMKNGKQISTACLCQSRVTFFGCKETSISQHNNIFSAFVKRRKLFQFHIRQAKDNQIQRFFYNWVYLAKIG